jgi:diaminopimelate epimerase
MKRFSYTKINGAGNDFVLIDKKINPKINLSADEISKICDRSTGIGADGVLIIDDTDQADFEMQYFNADGSTGSLCGNGARCAIKYAAISKRVNGKQTNFISNSASYKGELLDDSTIKFSLLPPNKIKLKFKVKAHRQFITAHYAETGSPHVVIYIEDILSNPSNIKSAYSKIDELPVRTIGAEIRNLPEFAPDGVNVNFLQKEVDKLLIRSYEKGVENETLACGTGAVAAAIVDFLINKKIPPTKLITKSNAELIVNFETEKNTFTNVSLTGPVEIEFQGNYSI